MPLLPIKACIRGPIARMSLKGVLRLLCILILILSLLPLLLVMIFCYGVDPISFSTSFLVSMVAVVVLVILPMEDIRPAMHFTMCVVWVVVTVYVALTAIHLIGNHSGFIVEGTREGCVVGLTMVTVSYIAVMLLMIYGILVYWSFYVINA